MSETTSTKVAARLKQLFIIDGADEVSLREGLLRLVTDFPASAIRSSLRKNLRSLEGTAGQVIARLVEAVGDEALAAELADSLEKHPNLEPERTWDMLNVLLNFGVLDDRPLLLERLEEWNETIEESESLTEDLSALIEEPEVGPGLVIEGLNRMEHTSRVEVILSFSELPLGPGLSQTLEILAASLDPSTRIAATKVLEDLELVAAKAVSESVEVEPGPIETKVLGMIQEVWAGSKLAVSSPVLLGSLVSGLDGQGRATVALHARKGGQYVAAAFQCDVMRGVIDVVGKWDDSPGPGRLWLEDLSNRCKGDVLSPANGLAPALLSGGLSLGVGDDHRSPIELGYWLAATLGQGMVAGQVKAWAPPLDLSDSTPEAKQARAEAVLSACDFWVDDSDLIYDLAEELLLRQDDVPPDPVRDEGLFRYAFEHRMRHRMEQDHRMMLWMASLWAEAGEAELARSAFLLAGDLVDAENAMPGHPFIELLTTRSLLAAQEQLRQGRDLRDFQDRLLATDDDWL